MQFKFFIIQGFTSLWHQLERLKLLLVSKHFWFQQMDAFPRNYRFTLTFTFYLLVVMSLFSSVYQVQMKLFFFSFPFLVTFHKIGSHHTDVFRFCMRLSYPVFLEHTFNIAWWLFPAPDAAEFPESFMLEGILLLLGSPAEEQILLCFQFRCWKLFGAAVKLAHLTSLPNYFQTVR